MWRPAAGCTGRRLCLAAVVASLPAAIRAEARVPVGLWRGEEMLRLAKQVGADLVVTEAHRVGGLCAIPRDAVPDRMLRHAPSAVLVVGDMPRAVDGAAIIRAATAERAAVPSDSASAAMPSRVAVLACGRGRLPRVGLRAQAAEALDAGAPAVPALPRNARRDGARRRRRHRPRVGYGGLRLGGSIATQLARLLRPRRLRLPLRP